MKLEKGEIAYHVVYVSKYGYELNEIFYIYRPGCNYRVAPECELARWCQNMRNHAHPGYVPVTIKKFYLVDHEGNLVDWYAD